jgi:hypothetical protein
MDLTHYFASISDIDVEALLGDWRWLVGDKVFLLHRATAMGSLFLSDSQGAIYFLDTTDGTFRRVADSVRALDGLLEDRNARRTLLWSFFVRELRSRAVEVGTGQCYSWMVPPFLGGASSPENIEVADLMVHVSILGQLHRQVQEGLK